MAWLSSTPHRYVLETSVNNDTICVTGAVIVAVTVPTKQFVWPALPCMCACTVCVGSRSAEQVNAPGHVSYLTVIVKQKEDITLVTHDRPSLYPVLSLFYPQQHCSCVLLRWWIVTVSTHHTAPVYGCVGRHREMCRLDIVYATAATDDSHRLRAWINTWTHLLRHAHRMRRLNVLTWMSILV